MNFNLTLGMDSFVPFEAYRLNRPKLLWINLPLYKKYGLFIDKHEVDDEVYSYTLDKFAFSTLGNKWNESSTFYAERYGGLGISYNGGGARAGINGNFQVKGIGPTPLVGDKSPFWYSNGLFPLAEAIKEVVWSEVLNSLLPHGAVECLAIIDSGIDAFSDVHKNKVRCRGGLVVRENALRVAHFERASLFSNPAVNFVKDYDRTEQAINYFLTYLDNQCSDISTYLEKVVYQWAQQIAYARSNSIMHGSLSSSNMCIDGRWIDFGTATCSTHYTNVIAAIGNESFWDEEQAIIRIIYELVFHINKFSKNRCHINTELLKDIFNSTFDIEFKCQILVKLGVGKACVQELIQLSSFDDFYNLFTSLLKKGKMEAHTGVPYFSDKIGKYSFCDLKNIIYGKIPLTATEFILNQKFNDLINAYANSHLINTDKLMSEMYDNSIHVNHNYDYLHFDVVMREIEELLSSDYSMEKIRRYIESKVNLQIDGCSKHVY